MSRFLYSCKATYRHVSLLLIADYADFEDFLATKMHKKHKETKNIDTNLLDADCADYTDFVLAGLVFLANSALKASF
jgi:hypothetical protein